MKSRRRVGNYENNQFKSWGETQIARLCDRAQIPYFYEHPLAVVDDGKVRVWYPDFQLPSYGVIIEYFGRRDDPDYANGMRKKQAVYRANNLDVLLLTRDSLRGDWPGHILGQVEDILTERLDRFRMSSGFVSMSR